MKFAKPHKHKNKHRCCEFPFDWFIVCYPGEMKRVLMFWDWQLKPKYPAVIPTHLIVNDIPF